MLFFFFVLVNATLFIRPSETVPTLASVPLYNILILICLAASFPVVLDQFALRRMMARPISLCVLLTLGMVVLSPLTRLDFWAARTWGYEFAKVVLYYFLLLGIVNSPARLRSFLNWLLFFIAILTGLALVQYHGIAEIPAVQALERTDEIDPLTGEVTTVLQLRSTGIFNDPNDLCLILVVGIALSAHRLCVRGSTLSRATGLVLLGVFIYSVILTRSRSGFLALLATLLTLFLGRFGWRRTLPLIAVVLPAIFLLSGGRQTRISTREDTAQQRILLWRDGMEYLKRSPFFGIGAENFSEEMGLVAHNSYVQSYTELGILGGTSFFGLFYFSLVALVRLGSRRVVIQDVALRELRPFLLAAVAGYAVGLFSISRSYIVPTYLVAGIVAVFLNVATITPPSAVPRVNVRYALQLAGASALSLIGIYIFIRLAAR